MLVIWALGGVGVGGRNQYGKEPPRVLTATTQSIMTPRSRANSPTLIVDDWSRISITLIWLSCWLDPIHRTSVFVGFSFSLLDGIQSLMALSWQGRPRSSILQWYFSFKIHFRFGYYTFFCQSFLFPYYIWIILLSISIIYINLNNYFSFYKFLYQSFLFYNISVLPDTIISVSSSLNYD